MTEIELHRPTNDLAIQMDFARAVASASMLPTNYRGKPADIMLAVGLGQSMGLSPAESLYRISVIQGRPAANAELIAANVRKAGHRLRVKVSESPPSATCTIIRADDPDEPFVITRDMEWAKGMELVGKDNYKKQPSTMLSWRAISACARLACPEALYGVVYTPDEIDGEPRQSGGLAAAMRAPDPSGAEAPESVRADTVPSSANSAPESPPLNTGSTLARRMFALMGEIGIAERADRLLYVTDTVGREVTSSKQMTEADAHAVIDSLEHDKQPIDAEIVGEQA